MQLVKFGPNLVNRFEKIAELGQNLLKYTLGYRGSAKIRLLATGI